MNKIILILTAFFCCLHSYSQNRDLKRLPKVVDLKPYLTAVKNQDWRGSCSFFATVALVEAEFKKLYNKEVDLSEQFVNYNAKIHLHLYDNEEESSIKVDALMLIKYGLLYEEQWPYHPSYFLKGYPCDKYSPTDSLTSLYCFSQQKPPEHVTKKAFFGKFRFKKINRDIDTLTSFIAHHRKPLAFLFPFNDDNWTDTGRVFYSNEMDSICVANNTCSNHIAVISGYDLDKKIFFIRNSWGDWWGEGGYGTLSFDDFEAFAGDDIFYFEIENPDMFKLPREEKIPPLKFKSFAVNPTINADKSISLDITGEVQNIGWHSIAIRSVIVTAPDYGKRDYNLSEMEEIAFSDDEITQFNDYWPRAVWAHVPEKHCMELKWSKHNPLKLSYSKEMIGCESVQKALQDNTKRIILMTSLYYFDDTDGFKKLKRIFIDLDRSKLIN